MSAKIILVSELLTRATAPASADYEEKIMITIIASESFVQSLIDEQCRDFLNDYLREQRRIEREARERKAYQTLRETEEQLKAFYEAVYIDAFEET